MRIGKETRPRSGIATSDADRIVVRGSVILGASETAGLLFREIDERAGALAPGECVLIRPDGYVGAILGANRNAALESHLIRMGLARVEGG